jgi:hypothetical protein
LNLKIASFRREDKEGKKGLCLLIGLASQIGVREVIVINLEIRNIKPVEKHLEIVKNFLRNKDLDGKIKMINEVKSVQGKNTYNRR